jgi:hypothetical protein
MVAWYPRSIPINTSTMGPPWWLRVVARVAPSRQTQVLVRGVIILSWGSDKVFLPTTTGALPRLASPHRVCLTPDFHLTIVWISGTRRIMGPSNKVMVVSWRMVTVAAVGEAIGPIHQVTAGWDTWEEVGPQMDIKHQWCLRAVNSKLPQSGDPLPSDPEVLL